MNNPASPSPIAASAPRSAASKGATIVPVIPDFDLTSVRCAVEQRLGAVIRQDEDLLERVKALAQEHEHVRVRMRLDLMTDGYRVDEMITPKLFRLGAVLSTALRLVHPLDIFVQPSHDLNAFCLPSRKGNRLVMCLNSGLLAALSSQELLFVMGHEAAHAILRHGETLGVHFDHPDFSPLEVVRIRGLERAYEISCDRFGLLACQDVRVASTAMFKIASGLSERWIAFDETAYSRHFDELSSMSEFVDIEDAARTHPLMPLRVKALIAFSKSELYARAFGKGQWSIPTSELERRVETMLSVLDPDVSEFEGKDEKAAANQFIFDGALRVIAADGCISPDEVAWLQRFISDDLTTESLVKALSDEQFCKNLNQRLEVNAGILRNKLSDNGRANLFHLMCDVAVNAGGFPESELEALDELRQLLRISTDMAQLVLHSARTTSQDDAADENEEDAGGPVGRRRRHRPQRPAGSDRATSEAAGPGADGGEGD